MRASPPDLPGAQAGDSPIDRALTLLLAEETEAALRWSAAVVERDPSMPSALVITCRLLQQMGRTEPAAEGIELAAHCRRRMVANLARTSPVLVSVPAQERVTLVERFQTRIFEKGDKLV